MKDAESPSARATAGPALSVVLHTLAGEAGRERISVGDLLAVLGDRGLAALLFIFAAPNVLPVPPGTSAVLGAPLVVLAAQLALGRAPWLPAVVSRRSLAQADFATVVRHIMPWLQRAEKLLRPRLGWLAAPPMDHALGLVCLLLAVVLVLPVPLGNVLPALAISVLALAMLEQDGLWVLAGLATATAAGVVVSGVVYGLLQAAAYLVVRLLS